MKDNEYIEKLIARFLNGNCTAEEHLQLKGWIDKSSDHKGRYLAIKDIWDSVGTPRVRTDEQLVLFYKNQLEKAKKSRMLWIRFSLVAAAILLLGLVISILIPQQTTYPTENFQVFSVPLGSKSKVLLADGTEVNLNSGSELKYSNNYSSSNRVVSLSGEGYFKVKSDPVHPFIVRTSDFDIQVTGTEFNVCLYADNDYAATTLAVGKIGLKMKGSSNVLAVKPGEKFLLYRGSRKYSLKTVDVESEIAWKDGEFIFRKIPFPELVQRLERWYDVKLDYSNSDLKKLTYTGRFKNQETIWQVLDALKLTSPIDYSKTTFREFNIKYKPMKLN
ncbi:MAG TPA: FecR domain-containing protein [Prolixibacteraceae bacterium]|nr:FecR domain-containing protein [Prolixibacteraceae bacterium]